MRWHWLHAAVVCSCAVLVSCIAQRHSFRIIPSAPSYLLRTPDSRNIPFPDILRAYNGYEPAKSWMDLDPLMALRIENAYYMKGAPRQGLEGFLGTETATYEVTETGLRLLSFQPMPNRPEDDSPVQNLISPIQTRYRYHRLYYEVFFRQRNNVRGSVLLGANSPAALERLSAQMARPESVCNSTSTECTVFPDACTVSVEMQIVVNGKTRSVIWRAVLGDVVSAPVRRLELKRLYGGRLIRVEINPQDSEDLRLPLLPGDHVTYDPLWNE
jgi:tRNA threonylcarbamoyladenosine modification (KEOPS) complex  Pcc1 subunit